MNEQMLEMMATKLGVGVEFLWSALIRQAPIAGAMDIVIMAAIPCAFYAAHRLIRSGIDDDKSRPYDFPWRIALGAGLGIASTILSIVALSNLSLTLAAFANPEYWALHEILSATRRR